MDMYTFADALPLGITENQNMPSWLENFVINYQLLDANNVDCLKIIYHTDIHFQDPMHTINGIDDLLAYFIGLYQHVSYCQFTISNILLDGNHAAVYWTMEYCHHRLNHGELIVVEGHSLIIGEGDKVIFHRDYLDLGQMLYEHIPLLGRIVRWIKVRASQ